MSSCSQVSNSAGRIKVCLYLIVTSLHLIAVGYVLEFDTTNNPLLSAATAAGLISSVDLCFVVMAFLSPIVSFLNHLFSFGITHHSPHKLHFHQNMAISAIVFFFIHILLHTVSWILYNNRMHLSPSSEFIRGIQPGLYSFDNASFVTGIIMVICFLGELRNYKRKTTIYILFRCTHNWKTCY